VARIQSAVKNIRKNRRRREINRARRSRLRSQIRKIRELVANKDAQGARAELPATLSLLDRSQTKGVIHRNTAARHKSRLTRLVASLAGGR
jgi:small subunit ribosomal protein S20